MGQQIIKQPNGKYCLFSSIVNNVSYYNLTAEEIIDQWTEDAKRAIKRDVMRVIESLEKGEKPYYQFTMNFEELIDTIKDYHGEEEAEEIKTLIESKTI